MCFTVKAIGYMKQKYSCISSPFLEREFSTNSFGDAEQEPLDTSAETCLDRVEILLLKQLRILFIQ